MGQLIGIAVVWFIIEILLWYLVAQFISGWWVFLWFIVSAIIGMFILRTSLQVLNPMAQQMKAGGMLNPSMRPQEDTLMRSVAKAIAGFLLLVPGLMSDALALIVMLPPVQRKLKKMANDYAMNNQQKMMEMMAKQMGGQSPFGGASSPFGQSPFGQSPFDSKTQSGPFFGQRNTTVDGTAKPVLKKSKQLNEPANDE